MISYKYNIYHSRKTKYLDKMLRECCFVWNHALALQRRYHKLFGKYISVGKMKKYFAKRIKRNLLHSQTTQEILERLDESYNRFFKKLAKRPPKFKSPEKFNSLAHQLCKQYDYIFIEDLNIEGMKRLWGKKVSDLSHSSFIDKLTYVASKYGVTIHKIDIPLPLGVGVCQPPVSCGVRHYLTNVRTWPQTARPTSSQGRLRLILAVPPIPCILR